MAIKVGINGFGRIGRVVLRIMSEHPEKFDICGINLRKADLDYMVYLVKYDSVFRQFNGTVEHDGENLILNGHKIHIFSEADAAQIKWADYGVEYVIESTGVYTTTEKASAHFVGGAKKVYACASHGVLSGPALERLANSNIEELALLDTIPAPVGDDELAKSRIKYLTVAPMFAEAIERTYQEISIAKLFN